MVEACDTGDGHLRATLLGQLKIAMRDPGMMVLPGCKGEDGPSEIGCECMDPLKRQVQLPCILMTSIIPP